MDLTYGVSILAVDYFVLSQSTRLTDGQTDTQTERRHNFIIPRANIRSRTVKTLLLQLRLQRAYDLTSCMHINTIVTREKRTNYVMYALCLPLLMVNRDYF